MLQYLTQQTASYCLSCILMPDSQPTHAITHVSTTSGYVQGYVGLPSKIVLSFDSRLITGCSCFPNVDKNKQKKFQCCIGYDDVPSAPCTHKLSAYPRRSIYNGIDLSVCQCSALGFCEVNCENGERSVARSIVVQ